MIGGNYDEVIGRLQSEELVCRLVKRFLTDRTHENLVAARNNNDIASAFRAAHTLKGVYSLDA
ncbi:MAG: Hpt domain-containing protein [Ruminococcus sp.]|nr:Hpt domain-containing protein [Ruminococcus sp.]